MNLAQKYRPQEFSAVLGQDVAVRIMVNSIILGRERSMLLYGGRGTGKTTLSRLYAKALNCEHFAEYRNVCGTCAACQGSDLFVIELDAASHSGVDDIRELEKIIKQRPAFKKTVVILDECHMLSTSAQNALLKTLEEPPEHVVFMLVTTDPEKLAKTVRSRCLSMPLRALSAVDATRGILRVLEGEGVAAEGGLVESLAVYCDGSLRDVYQILEQLFLCTDDGVVRCADLESVSSIIPVTRYLDLAGVLCALTADPDAGFRYALEEVERWHGEGCDLQQLFLDGVPVLLRDFSIYLANLSNVESYMSGISLEVFNQNATLTPQHVSFISRIWEETYPLMKTTTHPKVMWGSFLSRLFFPV